MTAPYAVDPADEARHTPEPEDLWSESYYADFVDDGGSLGGWLRLGMYPNRSVAWWTAYVVGTDRPGVCSVNYVLPVPAGGGLVTEDAASRVELELRRPLEEFRIAASADALVFEQPEQAYGDGAAGTPARLGVDLTWTTDGTPYHYGLTTRYEIPCNVAGTVTIDRAELTIAGQGQRDHSWAARDWWAFGWCWSSARLEDGTRIHLSDIRMPGFPVFFGYVQTPGGGAAGDGAPGEGATVHPITALSVKEAPGPHGFPSSARIEISTGVAPDLGITVTPLAFGPVLLRDEPTGRTSHFPRAMVTYAADDGRSGLGWIEWNQPDAG
jgi:hypothetical protein